MIPEDIADLPEHWRRIREPLNEGDHHEVVKRLRLLVDADPFALVPRHVLASLLVDAGHRTTALLQFEKLLTAAVTRGDLFRAIAAQRRIDELAERPLEAATYIALHRWFRLAGAGHLLPVFAGAESGLTPVRLLRLPAPVFAWVATQARLQRLGIGWHIEPFAGACQWSLMWGELRWEVGRREPRPRQRRVAEGESIHAVVEGDDHAPLRIAADLPSECLVFDPLMLRQLATADPQLLEGSGAGDDIIREDRNPVIPRTGPQGDLDARPNAPWAPNAEAPPTLQIEASRPVADGGDDARDWLEPGLLSFDDDRPAAPDAGAAAPLPEIPGLERGTSSIGRGPAEPEAPRPRKPLPRGRSGELELPDGPITPSSSSTDNPAEFGTIRFADDGSVAPPADTGTGNRDTSPATRDERRRRDRTPVAYRGTVRLLGLGHALGVEMDCTLVNLSPAGARIELPADAVLPLVRILEGETLRIELEPNAERLQLAGGVRWLEIDVDKPVTAGIEFVLLTRADVRAIRRLIARARRSAGLPAAPEAPGPADAAAA